MLYPERLVFGILLGNIFDSHKVQLLRMYVHTLTHNILQPNYFTNSEELLHSFDEKLYSFYRSLSTRPSLPTQYGKKLTELCQFTQTCIH